MANKNIKNFGNRFNSETGRASQKLAVKKRQENKQRRKDLREVLSDYMFRGKLDEQQKEELFQKFPNIDRTTKKAVYFFAKQLEKAMYGDTDAFRCILETIEQI